MSTIQPIDTSDTFSEQALDDIERGKLLQNLSAIRDQNGSIANIFKTMAHSPAVLDAYLAFNRSLSGSQLSPALREQIALTVAGLNRCDYCASAHSLIGKSLGLERNEVRDNLIGRSDNPHTQAVLNLVSLIVQQRGRVDSRAIETSRQAGITDRQLTEIVAVVAINLFTNYFNHVAGTDIDFPVVETDKLANVA